MMEIHLRTRCKVFNDQLLYLQMLNGLLILLHSFLTQRFILKLYI
ncbi:Uncharacterised protein [Chryseobacterium indoltheticum]|uniref:Uncharacterized protein n=1 Tax=Chryseobacterium indoltheticum TaxID=254 RepID=A0A381F9M9_9FLAO|nr:Uncharacterised protein [Chryseobacterium indoltheticum]